MKVFLRALGAEGPRKVPKTLQEHLLNPPKGLGRGSEKVRDSGEGTENVRGVSLPASPRQQPGISAETDGVGDPRARR